MIEEALIMSGDDISNTAMADWWSTGLTSIQPNEILIRGYPIQELIGNLSFPAITLLMLTGEIPSPAHTRLLEAAMVATIDHGPQAPSVATARMAATCGVAFNGIVAASVSLLGDVHGGAGQQCLALLYELDALVVGGEDITGVVRKEVRARMDGGEHLPGFGHRFHTVDPRAKRLQDLVAEAATEGAVSGRYRQLSLALTEELASVKGRPIAMNIDGATAMVYGELGLAPELARALFVLSRSVGLIANAWEEMQAGSRLKGPIPSLILPTYTGPPLRHL
jgi:citrate synthase